MGSTSRPTTPETAPAGAPRVRFEDGSVAAGIQFRHRSGAFGRRYMVETMGPGCAVFDFDGDGALDLYFPNGTPLPTGRGIATASLAPSPRHPVAPSRVPLPALYRNDGAGHFTDVTRGSGLDIPFYGMGCAAGDYDSDGRTDLYVTAALGPSRLFHNLGGGRFQDVTAAAGVGNEGDWGTSCAWLDDDRDGDLDLFVANYIRYRSLRDDLPCATAAGIRTYCLPLAYEPARCRLYRNDGGRFRDVSLETGIGRVPGKSLGVLVEDVDADGWPDLLVANDTEPNFLFHNDGNGAGGGLRGRGTDVHFSERGLEAGLAVGESGAPRAGMGIDAADAGNDGRLCVAVTHFASESLGFYREVGDRLFTDQAEAARVAASTRAFLGFGVLFLDADNDGWEDLFVLNGHVYDNIRRIDPEQTHAQRPLLFLNHRDGTYAAASEPGPPFARAIVGRGVARADLDGDGRLDLVVTTNNGPAALWMNRTEGAGHWLTVRLAGRRSNRDGVGAVVRLTVGSVTQRRFVSGARGYLSASDLRLHFGLGGVTRVNRLDIAWPSGTRDVLRDVPADRVLTVREGASHSP